MASRPVDRGFRRRRCFSTSFYPVKSHFGRMGTLPMTFRSVKGGFARTAEHNRVNQNQENSLKNVFRPAKGRFARTKLLIAEVQSQASRPIELGAAIEL